MNFANLERFVKFSHFHFTTDAWIIECIDLLTIYGFGTSRALHVGWMDSIRGPSYQIHKERSPNKYPRPRFLQQTPKPLYFRHLPGVQGQGAYLKMSVEKVEIGKRAAEHGALASIRY